MRGFSSLIQFPDANARVFFPYTIKGPYIYLFIVSSMSTNAQSARDRAGSRGIGRDRAGTGRDRAGTGRGPGIYIYIYIYLIYIYIYIYIIYII